MCEVERYLSMIPRYTKEIEIAETGQIIASVLRKDGTRAALKFFDIVFFYNSAARLEKLAKKAHAWADKRIAMLERQEVIG